MRYAIVSDIHANYQSWRAILADIEEAGADTLVCLGDIVGYGPMPQAVLNEVRSLASGIVLGNHDAAACGRLNSSVFNPKARTVIEWTRRHLDRDAIKFLKQLPHAIEDGDLLFVHAEAVNPAHFDYVLEASQAAENLAACSHRVVFYGHTHHRAVFVQQGDVAGELPPEDFTLEEDCRYMINVGTAGEPRDPADLRARYVLFDSNTGAVQFRAVEFDADAYRADLAREGLAITPFFLRALDFAKGRYQPGALRLERAMTRRPAVPEAAPSTQTRRLVVGKSPAISTRPPNTSLPRTPVRRPTASLPLAKPRKSKANLILAIIAILFLVALIPVAYLAYRKHVAPPEETEIRFSVPYVRPK